MPERAKNEKIQMVKFYLFAIKFSQWKGPKKSMVQALHFIGKKTEIERQLTRPKIFSLSSTNAWVDYLSKINLITHFRLFTVS